MHHYSTFESFSIIMYIKNRLHVHGQTVLPPLYEMYTEIEDVCDDL